MSIRRKVGERKEIDIAISFMLIRGRDIESIECNLIIPKVSVSQASCNE